MYEGRIRQKLLPRRTVIRWPGCAPAKGLCEKCNDKLSAACRDNRRSQVADKVHASYYCTRNDLELGPSVTAAFPRRRRWQKNTVMILVGRSAGHAAGGET